jgi:hypothetical protein
VGPDWFWYSNPEHRITELFALLSRLVPSSYLMNGRGRSSVVLLRVGEPDCGEGGAGTNAYFSTPDSCELFLICIWTKRPRA